MSQPATNRQVPDNSILDRFGKQTYLGNAFRYNLVFTSAGTTEAAALLLANPPVAGSSFPNQVGLFVDLRRFSGLSGTADTIVRAYLNPVVSSAGTPVIPVRPRPASTTIASVGVLTSSPTVSGNGTLVESLSGSNFVTSESSALLILDPGQTLLLTVQSANAAVIGLQLGWYQL